MPAKSGSPPSKPAASTSSRSHSAAEKRFKGVRMRSWGKWVSEIRLPNTRARLWLGSFATAEQAARAFDVAVVCLRGRSSTLNFPDSPPAYAPLGLPHHQIQELAAAAAAFAAAPAPIQAPSNSSSMSTQSELELSSPSDQGTIADTAQCSSPTSGMSEVSLSPSNSVSAASPSTSSSSLSAASDDVEAACSSLWQETDSLEGLLRLDENAELSSLSLGLDNEGQALEKMVLQWEELLWGSSLCSSYSGCLDEQLSGFPFLPPEDDVGILIEPCLWNL